MNAFYSILYCASRPSVDERISIGLYLHGDNVVNFDYSKDKLAVLKGLLPPNAFRMIRAALKNFDQFIKYPHDKLKTIDNFELPYQAFAQFDESFVNFLATHSNNLLTFSAPVKIDLELNDEIFERLFEKYIFKTDYQAFIPQINIVEEVKTNLYPKILDKVNWEIELTSDQIPNLIVPTKVLFIGKNEVEVTGEAFDFEKRFNFLRNDIFQYMNLVHALKDNSIESKNFLVGDEPDKSMYPLHHSSWNELRNMPLLTYVSTNETEAISEYMLEHNVHPFIEEESIF